MWFKEFIVDLILSFLPCNSELAVLENTCTIKKKSLESTTDKKYKSTPGKEYIGNIVKKVENIEEWYAKLAIYFIDIDYDEKLEIVAFYKCQGEYYVIILKDYGNGHWDVLHNIKDEEKKKLLNLKYKILLRASLKPDNLHPASIKTVQGVLWGYIDDKGNFLIKPKFDYARDFEANGLAIVEIKELYGIIDKSGEYIVTPKYNYISGFSEGFTTANDSRGSILIDEKGNELGKHYDYIGMFSEGRATVEAVNTKEKYLYGYIDKQGNEVIGIKYESAGEFKNSKALVKIPEGNYELIGLKGEKLQTFKYPYVGYRGDGLLAFQESTPGKYGYIDENGNEVIAPKYTFVEAFNGGRAVVSLTEDYNPNYGLIDKKGNFIIKPKYNNIMFLGFNMFAVGAAIDMEKPYIGSKYAIANANGKLLTDFIYYNVSPYENGVASAYDDKSTFFIDESGNRAKSLPVVTGQGTLSLEGNLIKADVDNRTSYLDKSGKIIWEQNTTIFLNKEYTVKEEKSKPNKDYLVYYPQIMGIKDKTIEKTVNNKLIELSNVKDINSGTQLDYNYVGDFSIEFFRKNLLVLELSSYRYNFGAAHGMPTRIYTHIDLITGRFYKLEDLFKKDSNYVKVISDIIENQIKNDKQYSDVWIDSYKGIKADQPFYVKDDALYIYFYPYEIAPYAAGFPTFKILFKDIMNIINVNGEFWNCFHFN